MEFSRMVGAISKQNNEIMSASTWALCACLLTFFLNCSAFRDPPQIKVKAGEDVMLPCQDPRGADIEGSEWRRPEREDEVVFWLNGRFLYPHLSFRGRVELRDPEIKDGDVSVILKNVDLNDAGTYECYVRIGEIFQLISSIKLNVEDPTLIKVKSGEDVTLPCQDPRDADIEVLKWSRLDPEQDVFVWQKKELLYDYVDDPHESFHGRVNLRDPTMEGGDVSVILKNVSFNDSGTYECYVRKDNMLTHQLINAITLTIDDSGLKSGNTWNGGKVVMVVSLLVVAAVHFFGINFLINRKCKKYRKHNSKKPRVDRAGDLEL